MQIGGSALNRSQLGLIKALLHDILVQEPSVIHGIVSTMQISDSVDLLWEILEYVTKPDILSRKFCFFIDGLDEFNGPPREICDFICRLSSIQNVKLCVSSRQWNDFSASFSSAGNSVLQVHEHTTEDMRKYIHDLLEQDDKFLKLCRSDDEYERVTSRLVERARGVFFWVHLVVRDVRNNLANEDSITDFKRRVDSFPDDLDGYFQRMLDSIPKLYQRQAARVLLMMLQPWTSLNILELSPTINEDCDVMDLEVGTRSPIQNDEAIRRTRTRLNCHCKDLLYIHKHVSATDDGIQCCGLHKGDVLLRNHMRHCCGYEPDYRVDFLHRTVSDFLTLPDIYDKLCDQAGQDYDPWGSLSLARLYHMKLLSWGCDHSIPFTPNNGLRGKDFSLNRSLIALIPAIVRCADNMKDRSEAISILDEADRSLKHIVPRVLPAANFLLRPENILTNPVRDTIDESRDRELWREACERENLVLDCAVRLGIDWYISEKLISLPHVWCASSLGLWQWRNELLSLACHEGRAKLSRRMRDSMGIRNDQAGTFSSKYSRYESMGISYGSQVHLNTVELLLEAGADPNAILLTGFSAWYLVLRMIRRRVEDFRDRGGNQVGPPGPPSLVLQRLWGSLIGIFLDHGADPTQRSGTAEIFDADYPCYSLRNLIREACRKEDVPALLHKVDGSFRRWRQEQRRTKGRRQSIARVFQRARPMQS